MDNWQRQIILGTILGGSGLHGQKKYCLRMSSSHKEWLVYKGKELQLFATPRSLRQRQGSWSWQSASYPLFTELEPEFYNPQRKRIVKVAILDELRDIGLAIVFGDCGRWQKEHVYLKTTCLGSAGSEILADYLAAIFGKVQAQQWGNHHRVFFDAPASQQFIATVGHQLPEFRLNYLLAKKS